MSTETMIEDAQAAIAMSSPTSRVYVGCDSVRYRRNGVWHAKYSTVIVLHVDGSKGCRLFHNTADLLDYGSIKQRMLSEVGFAVEAALAIVDVVGDRPFEVHIDINKDPRHKSNVALKEAIGYVQGTLGFAPISKPDSWCATHTSDHVVRGKFGMPPAAYGTAR